MFIPLYDSNRLQRIKLQYVTLGLIAVNTIIWLFTGPVLGAVESGFYPNLSFGFLPADVFNVEELPLEFVVIPEWMTFFSYAFLHGDFWHLAGNMLFLWVFGDNVEDAMGHVRFLIFYLLCGAIGAFAHGASDISSIVPLIGASAAISGVVAAYLVLHPKVQIWILVLFRIPLRLPASIVIGFWIGYQIYSYATAADESISFASHLGGLAGGAILVFILKRRDVPLFDQKLETPKAVLIDETKPPTPMPTRQWGRKSN